MGHIEKKEGKKTNKQYLMAFHASTGLLHAYFLQLYKVDTIQDTTKTKFSNIEPRPWTLVYLLPSLEFEQP